MKKSSQVNQERCKAILKQLGCGAVLALCAANLSFARSSKAPHEASAPVALDLAELAELNLDLAGLRQAELSGRADELWATEPRLTLRAMLLRAGREVPATASAARRAERLAERHAALDWLRSRLDSDPRAVDLWDAEVSERLDQPQHSILWCATARTLGRLGDGTAALQVAAQLEAKDAQLALSARLALFDLYLRWFASQDEFRTFWPEAEGACSSSVFMKTAREKEAEARELQIQLLQHEPSRAAQLLESLDPRLRAAGISALGREQKDGAQVATDALLDFLALENSGLAFNAGLDALLQIQSAATSDDPNLQRLRGVLVDRIREGHSDLQAPVADALRRMPWSTDSIGEDSLAAGMAILVQQLGRLANPGQLTDRDVLVTCMASLHSLAARAEQAGLDVQTSLEPIAPMVIAMIEESRESDRVRIAASKFLPLVRDAVGIERAVIVLGAAESSEELRYNLLAAIGDMASGLDANDIAAQLVLETLLVHVRGDDRNLRRRSLKYLSSEAFAALVAQADPGAFLESLARETVLELQLQLLDLIAARGGTRELEQLIALPNFDAIASSGPAGVARLSKALVSLSVGDAKRLVQAMGRLLAVPNAETRVLRLRGVLAAIASLPEASLVTLGAGENHSIVIWAMELRGASSSVPGGQAFLTRLLDTHIKGCTESEELKNSPELAHVRALFLSDLIALDASAAQTSEVLEQFTRALELCETAGDLQRGKLVRRDRARYQLEQGEDAQALVDYRALLVTELPIFEADPATTDSVLDQRDLRRAGTLLATGVPGAKDDRAEKDDNPGAPNPGEALRVSEVLVRRPVWKLEPAALRLQDLRDLAQRALPQTDPARLERAARIFADLPELPAEPEAGAQPAVLPPAPEGALWTGLLGTREEHAELRDLARQLFERHATLIAPPAQPAEAKATAPKKRKAPDQDPATSPDETPRVGDSDSAGGSGGESR